MTDYIASSSGKDGAHKTRIVNMGILENGFFSFKLCKSMGAINEWFRTLRGARLESQASSPLLVGPAQTRQQLWVRAGDVSSTILSLYGPPRLQHVAVLCQGTRLKSRDNQKYHTEQLRGGCWDLHFGWGRELCTNSSTECPMIFSRRMKSRDLHRGKRRNGEAGQRTP